MGGLFSPNPPTHIYPGMVIPTDVLDAITFLESSFSMASKIPPPDAPWIPLDEDVLSGMLQITTWTRDIKNEGYIKAQDAARSALQDNFEKLYMEALWRKINKKNCSV